MSNNRPEEFDPERRHWELDQKGNDIICTHCKKYWNTETAAYRTMRFLWEACLSSRTSHVSLWVLIRFRPALP